MDDRDLAAAMRKPAEVASAICYSGYCLEQYGKHHEPVAVVRLPIHVVKNLSAVLRRFRQLAQTLPGAPRVAEPAQAMDKSVSYVEDCLREDRNDVSLEATPRRKGSPALAQMLTDALQLDMEESLEKQDHQWQIHRVPMGLDVRHRTILIHRFGMDRQEKETLSAIGKELGVSRERADSYMMRSWTCCASIPSYSKSYRRILDGNHRHICHEQTVYTSHKLSAYPALSMDLHL